MRRVDYRVVLYAVRERFREVFHQRVDLPADLDGIAARRLVDQQQTGRVFLEGGRRAVRLYAEFYPRDVPESHQRTVRIGPQHDPFELFGRTVLARHPYRIGEFRRAVVRFGSELTAGNDLALLADRRRNIADRDAEVIHLIRFDPYPHRVRTAAEHLDAADAVDPRDRVFHVDDCVVGQEVLVVSAVGKQRQYHDEARHGFLRGDALLDHRLR